MKATNIVALVLLIIGGINWGVVALAEYDLVAAIAGLEFGEANAFTRIVYGLVGLSAIWVAVQVPTLVEDSHFDRTPIR